MWAWWFLLYVHLGHPQLEAIKLASTVEQGCSDYTRRAHWFWSYAHLREHFEKDWRKDFHGLPYNIACPAQQRGAK